VSSLAQPKVNPLFGRRRPGRRIADIQNDGERWQVVVVDPVTGPNATLRVVPVDGGAAERTIAVTIAASGSISELGLEQPSWQRLAP